jgi:hypothetical protein
MPREDTDANSSKATAATTSVSWLPASFAAPQEGRSRFDFSKQVRPNGPFSTAAYANMASEGVASDRPFL